uniref:Uncharacterized protein n=1 Tax=Globodera rostochiensis TaxID=31243 RepID=A0A914IAE7_GLORO
MREAEKKRIERQNSSKRGVSSLKAEETTDALKERIGDDERMRYGRAALADGGAALKKILHHGYQTTRSVIGQPMLFLLLQRPLLGTMRKLF